jgi:hypothetical protein
LIEVGYAGPDDLEPARRLLKSTAERLLERLEPLWPPHEFTPEWVEGKFGAGELVVGREDGELVGCALVQREDPDFWPDRPEGEALYMHRICAAPEAKGGRFVTALFAWLDEEARRLGKRCLRLDCFPRPKLRAVYEEAGFEKVDDRWVHYLYVYRYERPVSPSA